MIYYNEAGEVIEEKDVDLAHGYLVDRDIVHHPFEPAVTHLAEKILANGGRLTYEVVDLPAKPEWNEVVSQTYYYTGPNTEDRISALEVGQSVNEGAIVDLAEGQAFMENDISALDDAVAELAEIIGG